MKVLWLTNSLLPDHASMVKKPYTHRGGWILALAEALVADGRVDLAVATNVCTTEAAKRSVHNILYYTVPVRSGNQVGRRLPETMIQAYQCVVRDFKPDIVHVHGTEYFHGLLARMCQFECPVVISIQGIIDVCRHHWLGGLSAETVRASRTVRDWFRRDGLKEQNAKLVERSAIEREIFAANSIFVGRTQWDRAHLRRLNPTATYYHCDRLLRVPFYSARWYLDRIRPHTVFASGANYPLKGFHVLVKAIAQLRDEFPDILVRVVGAQCYPGASGLMRLWKNCRSRGYARYLSDLIRQESLEDCINILPTLSAWEVANELKKAHVFVLPSFIENNSNSLAEAMMVGTPVVASFVGGIPSVVCPEESALMFPPGDEAVLADQIRRLFEDDDLAMHLSSQAMTVAKRRHSHARNVSAMVKIYEAVSGDGAIPELSPSSFEEVNL